MNVRFADRRPDGAYVLAVPLAAGAPSADRLAALGDGAAAAARAAGAARFDGEAGAIVELFVPQGADTRRVLLAGLGAADDDQSYERVGGALVARLLTSGETTLVIDLTGHRTAPARAARIAYAALLRGWRYDKYRTTMKPRQKPTLTDLVIEIGRAHV